MNGQFDLDAAIEFEFESRVKNIERLGGISAIILLMAATWLAWPALEAALNGGSLLNGIGYSLIILAWGLFVQDLGIQDSTSRSRIGAALTIAWLPIAIIGIPALDGTLDEQFGFVLLLATSLILFKVSRDILNGGIEISKFRSIMGFLGFILAISIVAADMKEGYVLWLQVGFCLAALLLIIIDWSGNSEQRIQRRAFDKRLNAIEHRILELKSTGAAVDQAASLVMTAREEGHRDPEWGMRLLDEADEDIERNLSLAGDVEEIKLDALNLVERSEEIAVIAKRPRKAFVMGEREVELGSLREGEALYRQAKKLASEIIEWWEQAESAIRAAAAILESSNNKQEHLAELLVEAKKKLKSEKPKQAYEFAIVIPEQIKGVGEALELAEDLLKDAHRQLKAADGIDKKPLGDRLDSAEIALEAGDYSQANGLAGGVIREIIAEREAMEDIRRALRQKVHLISRWEEREDSEQWDLRLTEIEDATDELQWTHAATLLDRLTKDLDTEGKASDEASELLEFIKEEWKTLRNQCEASGIKVDDDERHSTEEAIAIAQEAQKAGRIDEALESLGLADGFMERLRRRV
jgi:hypothetical protein